MQLCAQPGDSHTGRLQSAPETLSVSTSTRTRKRGQASQIYCCVSSVSAHVDFSAQPQSVNAQPLSRFM